MGPASVGAVNGTATETSAASTTVNGRAVGCRDGTREFAGACWDVRPSVAALTATEATAACAAVGGELPNGLELIGFGAVPGVQIDIGGEWINEGSVNNESSYAVLILTANNLFSIRAPTELHHFRCVTPLVG